MRLRVLLDKLEPVAQQSGHESFLEYYYALKEGTGDTWDAAWEALSVQETYFWREMAQVDYLVKVIVPEWFRKTTAPFKIWSAACASGEEPYSIRMALNEAGFGFHPIQITASDAYPLALKKAEQGIYRERSFRSLPVGLRQKYFTASEHGWQLSPEIIKSVVFKRANLLESGPVSSLARAHAVFCRNVFIYFSSHSTRQTIALMAARMPPRSHLFVGAAESLLRMTTDFEIIEIPGAVAYQRLG